MTSRWCTHCGIRLVRRTQTDAEFGWEIDREWRTMICVDCIQNFCKCETFPINGSGSLTLFCSIHYQMENEERQLSKDQYARS